MFDLNSITQTRNESPPTILIHGIEKIGKSTFFAGGSVDGVDYEGAPNPIFIRTESGTKGLSTKAFPICESLADLHSCLDTLINQEHDFKTVVLDSADWAEKLIIKSICEKDRVDSLAAAAGGYGKGYDVLVSEWSKIIAKLDNLNRVKKMFVGIICHSVVAQFNDPESEPYDYYKLKMHSAKSGKAGSSDMLVEWVDVCGFASRKTVTTTKGDKKVTRGVDISNNASILYLRGKPAYVAGNRFGMPAEIDLHWSNFIESYKANS